MLAPVGVGLLVACAGAAACARLREPGKEPVAAMEQTFDESANGRTIVLRPGQTFAIRLVENPTTGFRWQVISAGAPGCTLIVDHSEPPDALVPGRPGHRAWTFRVERPGPAVIELAARRSWEPEAPAASSFRLNVSAVE